MQWLQPAHAILRGWTDSVAAAAVAGHDRIVSPRVVRLAEQGDGSFAAASIGGKGAQAAPAQVQFVEGALRGADLGALLKGARVEIVLQSRRFLFRPLDVPARAADFVDGIVRAQIDRLTPWTAAEAVFGCSPPTARGAESLSTTVAATTRKTVMPYVEAVLAFHPATVAVLAARDEPASGQIRVFEQKARGHLDANRLSRGLLTGLVSTAAVALIAALASAYWVGRLSSKELELSRQISQQRAAIRTSSAQSDRSPVAALERRKHETPASVIVLDAITRVLPDNTYLTEFHFAGTKLQIAGVTRDAPALIPLIEQSVHFDRATFYAPTTRGASDPGERFHIETLVRPNNTLSP